VPTQLPMRRTCAVMDVHRRLLSADPDYRIQRAQIEDLALAYATRRANGAEKVRTIPVVVHVVHRTTAENIPIAQIKTQIKVLNADFRKKNADISKVPAPFKPLVGDAQVQFKLATKDIYGDATSGITRTKTSIPSFSGDDAVKSSLTGGADAWPARHYLNIWVCNLSDLLGYAQFPGGPSATDGVVINYQAFGTSGTATAPFNKGRTATHEVGHWLNLFHIWGDDGTGCAGSDLCADTPNQADENYGKPAFPQVSCSNGPNGDMFMNYMDYTDDDAMFMFTKGQGLRMAAALAGPRRKLFEALPKFPGILKKDPKAKPAVKRVQERLRDAFGHTSLVPDGVFGPKTEQAVKTFQGYRHGPPWKLAVDGIVGKKTWAALWA
jgi:hypothetical protein